MYAILAIKKRHGMVKEKVKAMRSDVPFILVTVNRVLQALIVPFPTLVLLLLHTVLIKLMLMKFTNILGRMYCNGNKSIVARNG